MVGATSAIAIDSSRRVGIGTTSPTSRITVVGGTTQAADFSITGNTNASGTGIVATFGAGGAGDPATTKGAYILTGASSVGDVLFGVDSSFPGIARIKTNYPTPRDLLTLDPIGSIVFLPAGNERARIDSSGRLLVGTSTSVSTGNGYTPGLQVAAQSGSISASSYRSDEYGGIIALQKSKSATVGTQTIVSNNDQLGLLSFEGSDGTNFEVAAQIQAYVDGTPGTNDMPGRLVFSTCPDGASSPVEGLRIDNQRCALLCGVTASKPSLDVCSNRGIVAGEFLYRGSHSATPGSGSPGTVVFTVGTNGDVKNTNNSYGSISDAKLKENIVNANSQWNDLKALQVRNYNFKEGQTHTQIGLVAQEVELVSPGLVSESPDRDAEGNDLGTVTKSVNYSVLYMKAVKALQEAMERIETLEAKVAALEGV
jgi:hypothetical protein